MSLALVLDIPTALSVTEWNQKSTRWMLDLGCSKYTSNHKSYFTGFTPCERVVKIRDIKVVTLLGSETVKLIMRQEGLEHFLTSMNELYAPDSIHNSISISQAGKRGFWVQIGEDPEHLTKEIMELIYKGSDMVKMHESKTHEGLYVRVAHVHSEQAHVMKTKLMDAWYQRLGHESKRVLRASLQHILGVSSTTLSGDASNCNVRKLEKSTWSPWKAMECKMRAARKPLKRIFFDFVGPMLQPSNGGS